MSRIRVLPAGVGVRVRAFMEDIPRRWHDLPADLRQAVGLSSEVPVPPPWLRHRVAGNSSRADFIHIGQECANDILRVYAPEVGPNPPRADWLDFGCGCGRVARHLIGSSMVGTFTGADVDARLVSWMKAHLPGTWVRSNPQPPLPFPAASFDVIVSVSVFTHLSEPAQQAWARELRRVLRKGGLLLVTTHPPERAAQLPPPFSLDPQRVRAAGFAHVPSSGPFNHQSSFQSRQYLEAAWGALFSLRQFLPLGMAGYQDLSVWAA